MRLSLRVWWLALAMGAAQLLVVARAQPPAQPPAQTPAQDKAVLAAVQTVFDGMAKRDAVALKATMAPGATLVVMRDGKLTGMTLDAWADRIGKPSPTKIEESIKEPMVRIDRDLAVVWAPFEVRTDGKLTSCGTDLFNLVRVDGKWLIATVAYTGRTDCAAK